MTKISRGGIFKGASAESAALSNNICTEDSLELDIILKLYTVVYFPESFLDDRTEDGLSFLRVERINTISPSASDELPTPEQTTCTYTLKIQIRVP